MEYIIHTNKEELKNLEKKGVYLIRNKRNNMLKIGVASNLKRRFSEIISQFKFCGSKDQLEIECFVEYENNYCLESYLHKEFKDYNYQNEWFDIKNINIVLDKVKEFNYDNHIKLIEENDINKNTELKHDKIRYENKLTVNIKDVESVKYKEYKIYEQIYPSKIYGNIVIRSKYVLGKDIEKDINSKYFYPYRRNYTINYKEPIYDIENDLYEEDDNNIRMVKSEEEYNKLNSIFEEFNTNIIIEKDDNYYNYEEQIKRNYELSKDLIKYMIDSNYDNYEIIKAILKISDNSVISRLNKLLKTPYAL